MSSWSLVKTLLGNLLLMREEGEAVSNSLSLVSLQVVVMVFQVEGGFDLKLEVEEMSVKALLLLLLLRVKEVGKVQEADFERLALRIARCRRS